MMETIAKYTIKGNPATKKNSQRIVINRATGRPFIKPSDRFEQWQTDSAWFLRPVPRKPIDVPVEITCIFFRESHVRCDLTNLLEAVDDLLVHEHIIQDDDFRHIVSHDGSRVYVDKENPRVEIEIKRWKQ